MAGVRGSSSSAIVELPSRLSEKSKSRWKTNGQRGRAMSEAGLGSSSSEPDICQMNKGFRSWFSSSSRKPSDSPVCVCASRPEVPGCVGASVLGDESLDFVRDPIAFVGSKCQLYGPVFKTRILNKTTILVTSNRAVREMLNERNECYDTGFPDHIQDLYSENILFADGEELSRLRSVIRPFFNRQTVEACTPMLRKVVDNCIPKLVPSQSIGVYEVFKRLASELSLALFLGLSLDEIDQIVDHVIDLSKNHWHGIISIPVKFLPSFLGSGFSGALESKDELIKIILERMDSGKLSVAGHTDLSGFTDKEEAARHILVFISALIPKAFGSLLTSFCLLVAEKDDVAQRCLQDESYFDDVLLEVSRLHPPFIGSRRIANQDHTLQDYHIPSGTPVMYITHPANHDPVIFSFPNEFQPERWSGPNREDRDRIFTLGAGGRECIGKVLSQVMFKECARSLLSNWTWSVPAGQDLSYKWLPVSRPSADISMVFEKRV